MSLSVFDLHCDTACEMLRQNQPLGNNRLAVSLQKASTFEEYIQVMAFWTDCELDNETGWKQLLHMQSNLHADASVLAGEATVCLSCPPREPHNFLLLSLEDARVLNGKLERVEALHKMGIRIITPLWQGESCMGGAHDTDIGLTAFGKQAMHKACSLGMLPDISHASRQSADDLFDIAAQEGLPVLASHSNAHAVCPVSRNLYPDQIRAILQSGGVMGINLYKHFLSDRHDATCEDVRRHTEYFLEQGAEKALCLGCDMDGAELPIDIGDLSALPHLAEYLAAYYPDSLIHDLFFENAYQFAKRHMPSAKKP